MPVTPNIESFPTEEFEDLQTIRGVPFPAFLKFRQLIITGPPGSGKTSLVEKIGGWPEEGYLDLSLKHWWKIPTLTFRPREVHLGFPFKGIRKGIAVHEKAWLEATFPLELDLRRIVIPPPRKHFFSLNWRGKYVFEFIIQTPEKIFELRQKRALLKTHSVDKNLDFEQVKTQIMIYQQIALHLHRSGMTVYVRDDFEGIPKRLPDPAE